MLGVSIPMDPAIREKLNIDDNMLLLVDMFRPVNRKKIPTYQTAQRKAIAYIKRNKAVESVTTICKDLDGSIGAREFFKDGSVKAVWCFIPAE